MSDDHLQHGKKTNTTMIVTYLRMVLVRGLDRSENVGKAGLDLSVACAFVRIFVYM